LWKTSWRNKNFNYWKY